MRKFQVSLAILIVSLNIISHSITMSYLIASEQGGEKNSFPSGAMRSIRRQVPTMSDIAHVELERMMMKGDKREKQADFQPSACQLVPVVHLLRHPDCQPKAIASYACAGSCHSYVRTSTSNFWQHERSCSCCQQIGSQEATFALDCPSLDPPYRKVKTQAPVECLCRACTDLGREDLRPQELVEALTSSATNSGFNFKTT